MQPDKDKIKILEWLGFKPNVHFSWWETPHGSAYIDDLDLNSLDFCFKWLEPELYRRGFRYQLTRLQDGHRAIIFAPGKAWADIVADAVAEKPATAFCKAIEQLI